MKNKILQFIIIFSFIFALGEMPKGWDKPSSYNQESKSIVGVWNIDVDQLIKDYKKSSDYRQAGESADRVVDMMNGIFSLMQFEFKDDGSYLILGFPNPNGETEKFTGLWEESNGFIILKSPEGSNSQTEELVFNLFEDDTLVPQNKEAGMFYLLREK